jgi:cytidine deaminase
VSLVEEARQARDRSYSRYSGHKVGAALRTADGKVFTGCNVENSSYGATVCAERVAALKAVSETGQLEIAELAVVTDAPAPWPPCGLCLQVIAEFARAETPIHLANLAGKSQTYRLRELLPHAFTPSYLEKK